MEQAMFVYVNHARTQWKRFIYYV